MSAVAPWPGRVVQWLDERGKFAWAAVTILGFILCWPIGLALLAYLIWSKRMFSFSCRSAGCGHRGRHGAWTSSGNTVFDAYKQETLDRLKREQQEFEAFVQRLQATEDRAQFDRFLAERATAADVKSEEAKPAGA